VVEEAVAVVLVAAGRADRVALAEGVNVRVNCRRTGRLTW
jgi:hypothetical protein